MLAGMIKFGPVNAPAGPMLPSKVTPPPRTQTRDALKKIKPIFQMHIFMGRFVSRATLQVESATENKYY